MVHDLDQLAFGEILQLDFFHNLVHQLAQATAASFKLIEFILCLYSDFRKFQESVSLEKVCDAQPSNVFILWKYLLPLPSTLL